MSPAIIRGTGKS